VTFKTIKVVETIKTIKTIRLLDYKTILTFSKKTTEAKKQVTKANRLVILKKKFKDRCEGDVEV